VKKSSQLTTFFVKENKKMNMLRRKKFCFFLASIFLSLFFVQISAAQDHLFLTGIIRSFHPNSGTIRVDVTSEGCKGLREFREPEGAQGDMDALLVGKQIHFYIDSSICERGKVYNILAR